MQVCSLMPSGSVEVQRQSNASQAAYLIPPQPRYTELWEAAKVLLGRFGFKHSYPFNVARSCQIGGILDNAFS